MVPWLGPSTEKGRWWKNWSNLNKAWNSANNILLSFLVLTKVIQKYKMLTLGETG